MSYAGASPWSLCGQVIQMVSVVYLNHLTYKKHRSATKGLLAISKNSGGSNKEAAHEEEGNTPPFPKRHGVEEDVFTLSGNIPSRRPQKRTLTFQKHLDASHQMFDELPSTQFYKEIYRFSLPPGMSTVLEISVVDGAAANSCDLFDCVEESIGSFMYIRFTFGKSAGSQGSWACASSKR
ncbi:hypothetical protein HID58_079347 [Brassica napus]|uniref:BnaCnng34650D protein n=2 Tax=Brassica napus TaxID=3708 RepID=A0A078J7D5_BRANA|nr:hypothetical protein HID58_079347 [Brassica napus]CAF2105840.1 unnamed protein product [Brassica napus]CDY59287.1 BnaCnng34650D [Brassica napus]